MNKEEDIMYNDCYWDKINKTSQSKDWLEKETLISRRIICYYEIPSAERKELQLYVEANHRKEHVTFNVKQKGIGLSIDFETFEEAYNFFLEEVNKTRMRKLLRG